MANAGHWQYRLSQKRYTMETWHSSAGGMHYKQCLRIQNAHVQLFKYNNLDFSKRLHNEYRPDARAPILLMQLMQQMIRHACETMPVREIFIS